MGKSVPLAERFWTKVDIARDDDCWEWTAYRGPLGYGRIGGGPGVSPRQAHRVAWELTHGEIPEGLHLDHLCRNPGCVNPAHLEPVTPAENLRRGNGASSRNRQKTECARGHEFTPENIYWDRGRRCCRECKKASSRAYYWSKR